MDMPWHNSSDSSIKSSCKSFPTKTCYTENDITETRLFKYIENFTTIKGEKIIKNSDIFHISVQHIDCGTRLRGGSNEYPQPMFLSRNKKNNVYPCKPQFYYIKVGFKGVIII